VGTHIWSRHDGVTAGQVVQGDRRSMI